jgi:hypothetical protein
MVSPGGQRRNGEVDRREFIVNGVLAGIAGIFRALSRAEEERGLTVQIKDVDVNSGTARLLLIVVPKETWFLVEGSVGGLQEGEVVQLRIRESTAHFSGREFVMKRIVFVP